ERDESMDHQPNGQRRKAALRKHRERVDQPRPQYRERDGPKQATPGGMRRDDSSGNSIGGHRRSSMSVSPSLPALGIGREQAEWHEWTDCGVLVIHDILFGQWKTLPDRLR